MHAAAELRAGGCVFYGVASATPSLAFCPACNYTFNDVGAWGDCASDVELAWALELDSGALTFRLQGDYGWFDPVYYTFYPDMVEGGRCDVLETHHTTYDGGSAELCRF